MLVKLMVLIILTYLTQMLYSLVQMQLKDGALNNLKIMLLKDLKMVQDGLIIQLIEIFI